MKQKSKLTQKTTHLEEGKILSKACSRGKINRILQIIYYFCSIRRHRSHPENNPVLFF